MSRFFAARAMLVVVAGFYVAGLVFVFLYSLGWDPTSYQLSFSWFSWPFDWPLDWLSD